MAQETKKVKTTEKVDELEQLKKEIAVLKSQINTLQKSDMIHNQMIPRINNHLGENSVRIKRLDDAQVTAGVEMSKVVQFVSSVKAEVEILKTKED